MAQIEGPAETVVFFSGDDGYHTYRIPSLIATPKGALLALCEGRKNGPADDGDIDLVMKRSEDGGETWSQQLLVHEEGGNAPITIGNPCPVVDYETGAIILTFCKNNREVFVTKSSDDGRSWSEPEEITADVKKPGWDWYATGPGHGIQLKFGPHLGRLVVPCDHRETGKRESRSHVFFSDDYGETWTLGGAAELLTNECEVVELVDGRLLLSMRNYHGKQQRAFCISEDGGASWSKPELQHDVFCPVCQASIHRHTATPRNRILYSGPGGPGRTNLKIRTSFDEGGEWPASRLLFDGPAGYSDLAVLDDGMIGCLFEGGTRDYRETIRFAKFSIDWAIEWTQPDKSPEAEFGHGLTAKDAEQGWISLFDGETAYGWENGEVVDGALAGPAVRTLPLHRLEVRGAAVNEGKLAVGSQASFLERQKVFRLEIDDQRPARIELSEGLSLKWLAIRPKAELREFVGENPENWKPLTNPQKPDAPRTEWTIENGVIRANGGPGALELQERFGNLILQIQAKTGPLRNGGLFFRAIPGDFMNGYEAQIFNACYDHDPALPVMHSTGAIDDRQLARRLVSRDGVWFTMTVIADGPHITTWVNGHQMVDWTDTREIHENPRNGLRLEPGTIQIQSHDPNTRLEVRSLKIAELPEK